MTVNSILLLSSLFSFLRLVSFKPYNLLIVPRFSSLINNSLHAAVQHLSLVKNSLCIISMCVCMSVCCLLCMTSFLPKKHKDGITVVLLL